MRLNKVKSARKSPGLCGKCRKPIERGESYLFWSPYRSGRQLRHDTPSCQPAPDELESNEKRAAALRAQAHIDDARNAEEAPHEAAASIRAAIDEAETIIDALDEHVNNVSGTPLEGTAMYLAFDDDKGTFEDWKDSVEQVANTLEELEGDVPEPGPEPDDPEEPIQEDDAYEDALAEWEDARDERDEWVTANDAREAWEEQIRSALDELEDVPDFTF